MASDCSALFESTEIGGVGLAVVEITGVTSRFAFSPGFGLYLPSKWDKDR